MFLCFPLAVVSPCMRLVRHRPGGGLWFGLALTFSVVDIIVQITAGQYLLVGEVHSKRQDFLQELQNLAKSAGVAQDVTFVEHRADLKEIMAVSDMVFSLSREPERLGGPQ